MPEDRERLRVRRHAPVQRITIVCGLLHFYAYGLGRDESLFAAVDFMDMTDDGRLRNRIEDARAEFVPVAGR